MRYMYKYDEIPAPLEIGSTRPEAVELRAALVEHALCYRSLRKPTLKGTQRVFTLPKVTRRIVSRPPLTLRLVG